jgi:dolichol-phosphate mannosyltransferase
VTLSGNKKKIVATLPTYNEAGNIEELIGKLRAMNVEVIVADDNSPDGTWKIVQKIQAGDSGVFLMRRMDRKGRGYAGAEAFHAALESGADQIVEMDADFSHRPEDLPGLLQKLDSGSDMVVGSRFFEGGTDARPSFVRRWITMISTSYARMVLGVSLGDPNSGYRAYTARAMEMIEPQSLISEGASIVHEVLIRAHRRGCRIEETPIHFVDRKRGQSQLTTWRLLKGFAMVAYFRYLAERGRLFGKK